MTITAPPQAARRAAALGLLGSVPLAAGQRKRLDLAALTTRLRGHGPALTPAAVAAHAASRPLGQEAAGRARHAARLARWQARHRVLLSALPATAPLRPDPEAAWAALRRTAWPPPPTPTPSSTPWPPS
ncbi:hypothetical protein [Streptomyces sp. NPDC093991]|uniref:hypothetical protein n=1 Tax=unclassified Streptomyces TaxID=2593676 RepID=UPI003440B1C8